MFFNQKSSRYALPAILASMLLVGCAKDLPEKVSEDIAQNVHSMALFDQEVVIETVDGPGALAVKATADEEVSGVFALNEMKLRKVKVISGDPVLAKFFRDLEIESAGPGQRITVKFKLIDDVMMAYALHQGQALSLHQEELLNDKKTELPLFQYKVSSYGILDKVENDLGEKTHVVTYKERSKDQSTHVTIDPKIEKRIDAGLRANDYDEKSVVMDKRKLHSKIYDLKQIKSIFANHTIVDVDTAAEQEKPVRLKFYKDKIIVLRPIKKKNLNPVELAALTREPKDPRIVMCDEQIRERTNLSKEDCVLRPVFAIDAKGVKLKRDTVDNQQTATVSLDSDIDHRVAKMIEVNLRSQVNRFTIGENFSFADKVFTSKADHYDTEAVYLYVPMTGSTPRGVTEADPFYQGKEKLVKLAFSKDGLEVREVEHDERFRINPLNQYPVMTIPGKHVDYKCEEDGSKQCLTSDQENNDISWDEKRFFIPELDTLKLTEVNPLDLWNVDGNDCVSEVSKRVTNHEIKKGVIFVEVEKTYRKSPKSWCIIEDYYEDPDDFTGLSTASFSVKFTYSLVRLDDIASKNYETVLYPIPDHGTFGFFTNAEKKLDGQFDPNRLDTKYFLHRWNPKKKKVVYYLSDSYNEPEQKLIKKATFKAVDTINDTLRRAEAGFEIIVKEPAGKNSGDLRNNVLQLVTDPLANGLLGYAPTVTNPLTGEIVQSHINMYSGVLKTLSRRIWEQMVDLSIEQRDAAAKAKAKDTKEEVAEETSSGGSLEIDDKLIKKVELALNSSTQVQKGAITNFVRKESLSDRISRVGPMVQQKINERLRLRRSNNEKTPEAGSLEEKVQKLENRLNRWAENNAYSKEFFPIAGTVKAIFPGIKEIAGVLNEDGTLKRWSEINIDQRKAAEDIMIPHAYTTTLVHEFGHALGLRHNFTGSFDSENFYTQEEANELGMHNRPAYSSVMDYGYSELNELPRFGKYDLAALRFGYARKVELADGEIVPVETTLHDLENQGAELKSYAFCTDENAGLSATCNRFDEGSTLVEVVTHYIDNYERSYKYRNFRDGRDSFSAYDLSWYLISRYREFNKIRDIMEEWEMFVEFFGQDDLETGCSPEDTAKYPVCKMINDRAASMKLAGDFMLKVLKTPDHLCALASKNDPETTVELRPLGKIYADTLRYSIKHVPTSCFDPAVVEAMAKDTDPSTRRPAPKVVKGEAGKFLNGFKDNDPNHIYVTDRFVIGVWMDKLMAMKSLFQRETGRPTTDDGFMAMVDHSKIGQGAINFVQHLLMGSELKDRVPFKKADGSEYQEEYSIDGSYLIEGPPRGLGWVRQFLGLPMNGKGSMLKSLLGMAKQWGIVDDEETRDESRRFVNMFTIRKNDLSATVNGEYLRTIRIGERIYAADSEMNGFASLMIDSINSLPVLKRLGKEKVTAIFNERQNPTLPDDLTDAQMAIIIMPEDLREELYGLMQDGFEFPPKEAIVARFGPELGTMIHLMVTMPLEEVGAMMDLIASFGKAPADATNDEKAVFELNMGIINDFLTDKIEEKNSTYRERFEIMPNHVYAF